MEEHVVVDLYGFVLCSMYNSVLHTEYSLSTHAIPRSTDLNRVVVV
jgi:hypothetical protein